MELKQTSDNGISSEKKKLLIIGGGFAGFWSALSAVRQSRELQKTKELDITLVNTDNYFTIRPRLYEVSLEGLRVPLDKYLKPTGVHQIIGTAEMIFPDKNEVTVKTPQGVMDLHYDYLVLATGGTLRALNVPGIEYTYNVDTFNGAKRLEDHIKALARNDFEEKGADTFVVAGAGFTGLETVTRIREKVSVFQKEHYQEKTNIRVYLIDRGEKVGSMFSEEGQEYVIRACKNLGIEVINETTIDKITTDAVQLSNGQNIPAKTVIWTIGMVASSLTRFFNGEKDHLNRLIVDKYLKLPGYDNVIITGDVASASIDDGHTTIMTCQYAQFMGRWAGHNAVNDLFSEPLKEYDQKGYVTCLDLGEGQAVYSFGWDRVVQQKDKEASETKKWVNTILIYPNEDVEKALEESYPEIPQF